MKMFYEKDTDPNLIKNKKIAIANPIWVKLTPAIPVCQISKNKFLKFSNTFI